MAFLTWPYRFVAW